MKINPLKKFCLALFIAASLIILPITSTVRATDNTASSTAQALIQTLEQQIAILKAKIAEVATRLEILKQAKAGLKEATQDVKGTLRLINQLKLGAKGEQVKTLQEILATDPEIYPEKLITGNFGALTAKAIKKFQKKWGIKQEGEVGPKTLSKINEILKDGAGNSGKVPPGLLIAPGILKKIGYQPQPLPGQDLPPGIAKKLDHATTTPTTTPDIQAPVISDLQATGTTATSVLITWTTDEPANSKIYYGTSTPLGITAAKTASAAALTLSHSLGLSELTTSTTYYYLVTSVDATGNAATSSEKSFITLSQ